MKSFLFILVLISSKTNAQLPEWQWARHVTTAPHYSSARARTSVDNYGNFYILGVNNGTISSPAIIIDSGAFVAKYSATGNLKWSRHIKGFPYSIACDTAGNVYIGGSYGQIHSGGFNKSLSDTKGILLMKLDFNGNTVWDKDFKSDYSGVSAMTISKSGNLYVTGAFGGTLNLENQVVIDTHNVFIAKINSNGFTQWTQSGSKIQALSKLNAMHTIGETICLDKNENVYLAFKSFWKNCYSSSCDVHSLVKLSSVGKILQIGNIGNYATGIAVDDSTHIFIVTRKYFTSGGEIYLNKLSNDLKTQYWRTYLGGSQSGPLNIDSRPAIDSAGNIFVAGTVGAGMGWQTRDSIKVGAEWVYKHEYSDAMISKIEPDSGIIVKNYLAGSKLYEYGFDICIDKFDNLYLTGLFNLYPHSMKNDTFCLGKDSLFGNNGMGQYFVAKLKFSDKEFPADLQSIKKNVNNNQGLNVYPSPCDELLTIDLENISGEAIISITDIYGQCVARQLTWTSRTVIETDHINAGVYFLSIQNGDAKLNRKIIIE